LVVFAACLRGHELFDLSATRWEPFARLIHASRTQENEDANTFGLPMSYPEDALSSPEVDA
jgi:hypothetical protein